MPFKWFSSSVALKYPLPGLVTGIMVGCFLLNTASAQMVQFDFNAAEGFLNGDIANHRSWISNLPGNLIVTNGTGGVLLNPDTGWVYSVCTVGLSPFSSRIRISSDFSFEQTSESGSGGVISLTVNDSTSASSPGIRMALRRSGEIYWMFIKSADGTERVTDSVDESVLGLDGSLNDESDMLVLSMDVLRGTNSADWTVTMVLSNATQSVEVLRHVERNLTLSSAFYNAPYLFAGFSSSVVDAGTGTGSRKIDRFSMKLEELNPHRPVTNRILETSTPDQVGHSTVDDALVNRAPSVIPTWPLAQNISFFAIHHRLKEFRDSRVQLMAELESLPKLNESLQFEAYGYHGGYLPSLDVLPEQPRWTLDFTFAPYITLSKVVLVPAVDHRYGKLGSYGFPRRFRILSVAADGRRTVMKEWMDEDGPDPGRFPLIIDVPKPGTRKVRVEVFRGDSEGDQEVFALDELYGVMDGTDHLCHNVKVSSEYESLPYWSKQFLIDQKTSLGLPLGVRKDGSNKPVANDFSVAFDSPPNEGVVVELDLGQNRRLGWVTLFPAQSPAGIKIPGYGFPGKTVMDVVEETASGNRGIIRRVPWEWQELRPGNNVHHLAAANFSGRWIRLHFNNFPLHNGKRTFAMGEIHVYNNRTTYPVQQIRLEGFPVEANKKARRMVDGQAGGYPILFLLDWLHKIERRNQLERSVQELDGLMTSLNKKSRHIWQVSGVALGGIVVMIALVTAIVEVVLRRRHSKLLRLQISSDLHDDIGSKVAAISLASTFVETHSEDPLVRKRGARIHAISSDMHQALRDVLWLTDTRTDTLDQLFQKLIECARKGIAAERLVLKTSPVTSLPSRPMEVQVKRDILLFFKEALHNAASHSRATQIQVDVLLEGKTLVLRIRDNGEGFNLDEGEAGGPGHHGLISMRERSKRLHGNLEMNSSQGSGTEVVLSVLVS